MRRPLCLLCMLYAGSVLLFLRLFPLSDSANLPQDEESIVCTGEVYAIENKSDSAVVYLRYAFYDTPVGGTTSPGQPEADSEYAAQSEETDADGYRIICYFPDTVFASRLKIGNRVQVSGKCRLFSSAANDGQFDAKQYYGILELDFALSGCQGIVTDESVRTFDQVLYRLREKLAGSLDRGLDAADSGVMKAMLLGQRSGMDAEIKSLYQRNGIAHILAISGLHITALGMGMYRLCKRVKLPSLLCSLLSLCFILAFGKMTGSGASTVRSIVMFSLFLLAGACGRTYDMLTAMAVSAAALLIYRPRYLFHSGFLLSFGAIMGIALVAPFLKALLPEESPTRKMTLPQTEREKRKRNLRQKTVSSLAAGAAVLAATLPVQLFFFYTASPYSCILNLLILPFTGLLLAAGFAGAALGCLLPELCGLLLLPCRLVLRLYETLCRCFDALPGAQLVIGRPAVWKIVLYYGVLAALLLWGGRLCKRKRALILLAALFLLCVRIRTGTICTVLDVGQGDGIVVEEKEGATVMIDGGSSDVSQVGKYRIAPYLKSHGVGALDYVFLSHADQDHVSGVVEMLENTKDLGVKINCLVLTKFAAEDEAYQEILTLAGTENVRVLLVGAGDYIVIGKTRFTCVYPATDETAEGNDQSMVLLMETDGVRTLFTGDLTQEKEQGIGWEDIDILKVAHHGSRYSSTEAFLRQCLPETAVVSAGEDNSYGHPHKETLTRLQEAGAAVFSTKESGAVTIRYQTGKYSVSIHGKT